MRRTKCHLPRALATSRAPAQRIATICIVDGQSPGDELPAMGVPGRDAVVHRVTTFGDALRMAREKSIDLWVIHTDLANRSGIDLCQMLRQRHPKNPIYLLAEHHSAELERAAWAARPTLFGCRGQQSAWIQQWLAQHRSRHAHI